MKRYIFPTFCSVMVFSLCLYSYLDAQNSLTEKKMEVAVLHRELQQMQGEVQRLSFQIEAWESPSHLLELAKAPEYRHLRHPALEDVLSVPQLYTKNE